jgi:hypothetical protein
MILEFFDIREVHVVIHLYLSSAYCSDTNNFIMLAVDVRLMTVEMTRHQR